MKPLSPVRLFATPWTVAHQAPPSKEFSRQEYWSALPFPSPGDLPDPGIEPGSPSSRRHFAVWGTREALTKWSMSERERLIPYDFHCQPKTWYMGFPAGPVVKNTPWNAGDTGLSPTPGRSHMLWGNKTRVPHLLKPTLPTAYASQQENPPQWKARALQLENSPHMPQLEKAQ